MYDFNNYLSGEIRHLTFQKSNQHANWQESVKQKRAADIENRLGEYFRYNLLVNLIRSLIFQSGPWKRAHHPSASLMANIPSQHKAG